MHGSHQAIAPYPFSLLATFLIRQNSIDRTSARRDHIELQINLLAEQKATRSLDVLQRIADHLNVPNVKNSQVEELAQDTAVDEIARHIKAREEKNRQTRCTVAGTFVRRQSS